MNKEIIYFIINKKIHNFILINKGNALCCNKVEVKLNPVDDIIENVRNKYGVEIDYSSVYEINCKKNDIEKNNYYCVLIDENIKQLKTSSEDNIDYYWMNLGELIKNIKKNNIEYSSLSDKLDVLEYIKKLVSEKTSNDFSSNAMLVMFFITIVLFVITILGGKTCKPDAFLGYLFCNLSYVFNIILTAICFIIFFIFLFISTIKK